MTAYTFEWAAIWRGLPYLLQGAGVTVLISAELNLDSHIEDYKSLGIVRTYAEQLRTRLQEEIIHSWYGNARACVDIFRTTAEQPQHWDVAPRNQQNAEEESEPEIPQGGKHSVH